MASLISTLIRSILDHTRGTRLICVWLDEQGDQGDGLARRAWSGEQRARAHSIHSYVP